VRREVWSAFLSARVKGNAAMDLVDPRALHPLRTPARLAEGGLWVMAALYLLKALSTPLSGSTSAPLALASLLWFVLATIGWLYTIATFLVWLYQARENLDLRGEYYLRWAKGWSIGGWFIPLANLVIPARVVAEVHARSQPGAPRQWRMPRVVLWWWLSFILGVVQFTYQRVDLETRTIHVYGVEFWNLVNGVFGTIAALLAIRIVRRITAWQAQPEQPQPTVPSYPHQWQ
jgi:hypothetical protein